MLTLGIETSCDETAAAVIDGPARVLASVVSSQYVHARYGGVVPELAAREHIRLIVPVVNAALASAGRTKHDVNLIAVTYTPGLMGALLVGLPLAKALACGLGIPFVGVNHLEGHIFALRLEHPTQRPPFLAVILSGGHTELIVVEEWCRYRVLGSTLDDACGEAFDKVAKLLGLGYPGGAALEQLAREGSCSVEFPVADPGGLDFSFSGLKTAVLYYLRGHAEANRADVAASFQRAAVEAVVRRVVQAMDRTGLAVATVSGGVAANHHLRQQLADVALQRGFRLLFPRPEYCADNAAMIAAAGFERYTRFGPSPWTLAAAARTPLGRPQPVDVHP
ncbi:tRNA (adenosine(37)-N6)-threonylcarbamoyltransferase complex transferase subunit TsaD [candidate division WOR-3 bacterium]|nr:tRNA (adenosine(37)-N6)-threonylcarbamoyltransferase complex transferase subunit TsaD [candidate division WOR-3 bacterium]